MSKTIVVGVLGALLVGCGGGSSSSDSTGDTDSDSGNGDTSLATLSGRAAIGAPIANAPVDARCADGSGFTDSVTSDSSGRFQGQVGSASLPCALRINGGTVDTTLHSYADAAGNVNITPLTDLILAFATSVSPADWYDQSDRTQRAQGLDAALADFLAALRSQGFSVPGNDFNPFHTPFTIGDAADRLLQNLADAIHAMANVDDYTAFVDLMSSGNLVSIPQAPDPTDTNGGSGNGNGSGGGSGASAAACLGDIFSQEGTVLEQFRGTINPLTGELSETIIDQQEIGGLTSFRGNNARVINRKTVSNSIAPLTLYNRAYMRVDQAASIVHQYGSESLTGQNGTVTDTFWTEPSTISRFDLAPGESYQQIYTSYIASGGGAPTVESTNDLTTTYYGRETVTVPAGTFETCKFYFEEAGSHGGWTAISWVSVGDGVDVQGGAFASDGEEMITTQLQSYSINGVQQAP